MSDSKNVMAVIPLRQVVGDAALDTHSDYSTVERKFSRWAVRGLRKLTNETLGSGRRYSIINVNQHTNVALLPCDIHEIFGIYFIDDNGKRVQLCADDDIPHPDPEEIECEVSCASDCECCYPKQLCSDLTTTQEVTQVNINGTDYEKTVFSTLTENGEYLIESKTPYFDTELNTVRYLERKEYKTTFDVEKCGCIKTTDDNAAKLKTYCYDAWACYCAPCDAYYKGAYRLFSEEGRIQLSPDFKPQKIYMEWRGSLPKVNGEYVVPQVAAECLVRWIAMKEVEYKKGVSQSEKYTRRDLFRDERTNMEKVLFRADLENIVRSLLTIPKFNY